MQDKQGNTALHLAAKAGHANMVRVLLLSDVVQPGALTGKNKQGQVPLHCAALSGCQQTMDLLLQNGSSAASAVDKRGRTPAELAVRRGHAVRIPISPLNASSLYLVPCSWHSLTVNF